MTGQGLLDDFLVLQDRKSTDTSYRALALKWLDLILKDIQSRQDGYHWRFLEVQTFFPTALNTFNYALSTIASDIDTTKVIHVYDKLNDITYKYKPYESFKRFVADEAADGGDPYVFSIFAGNLILWPTPDVTPITGSADGTTADKLVDSTASFTTDGTTVGMVVTNTTDSTKAIITAIDDANTLSIDSNIFISGEAYSISFAVNFDYIKLIGDAADTSATISIPDKFRKIVIDGMKVDGYVFDSDLGDSSKQENRYERGIDRMRKENSTIITENMRPESHRRKHQRRDLDGRHGLFPLDDTNF